MSDWNWRENLKYIPGVGGIDAAHRLVNNKQVREKAKGFTQSTNIADQIPGIGTATNFVRSGLETVGRGVRSATPGFTPPASKPKSKPQSTVYGSVPASVNRNLAAYDSSVTLPNTSGAGNAGSSKQINQESDAPPRPSPTVDQKGRDLGKLSSAGFAEANGLLESLGISTVKYGGFESVHLPKGQKGQTDYEAMGGSKEDADSYYTGKGVETLIDGNYKPIEAVQTEGTPTIPQNGATKTTEGVNTQGNHLAMGSQGRYNHEFLLDRGAATGGNSTSMVGLRAAEASKGLLYASGKYWKANPNAGGEGQKDFVEISKDEWKAIKRGDPTPQQFADTKVGEVQAAMQYEDVGNTFEVTADQTPVTKGAPTPTGEFQVPTNDPEYNLTNSLQFTDKDRTGRYNKFR